VKRLRHLLAALSLAALSLAALSLAVLLLALCSVSPAHAQSARTTGRPKPKLLLVIVLDQFRAEYLTRYAPHFVEGGFKYLMRNGANLTNAHYSHATTYTGPGHALILSGSYGHTSGIIGNRWFNRSTNRVESMFFDPNAQILGVQASPKDDDTSPRNFIGTNLCDQLRLSNNFRSKVIAISNKDRAAIMLAGKLGKAYWYHEGVGGMTTSTHYMRELPAYIKAFNARKIPDSYYGKTWNQLLPPTAYSVSRPDNFAHETDVPGLGRAFPHTLTDASGKPTTAYYEAFTATPWANDYQLDLARLVIDAEQLGADNDTDVLGVSITATDIAGHSFGPDSLEVQDMSVRLDRQLAGFFRDLNRRFKPGEVAIALTSDHGACPIPEYMASINVEASRIKKKQLSDAINPALDARYGAPAGDAKWILALEDPGIYLNRDIMTAKKLDAAEVERVVGEAAVSVPGVTQYFTRTQLMNGQVPPGRWSSFFEKAFFPSRSGDVLLMTKPYYFWGTYGERDTGSTHGSPYEYDTHVPLILMGNGVRPGTYASTVDISDLAPTLAGLLGVSSPAGNEGRRLTEMLLP
jgi:predicted AlkP superfamily pyrophosphatase or phosphodiesterase